MWRLAWAVVALAVLAGCAAPTGPKAVSASVHLAPAKAPATTTTTTLPVTPIDWTSCNGNLECGTLVVPLDYADPTAGPSPSRLERHLAEDPQSRIGSLVINPGGPGVSGIDDFSNELSVLTAPLLDDFDIVTFDPRGVERSDPVTCGETPGAAPGPLSDPVPQTPTQQKAAITAMRQFGADCEKASGAVLPYIGTVDVARDLERLRVALGDPGLTFMGQSYGTLLGATYAEMYPTHVRAMVLDSAIDPAASIGQITIDQAKGFEGALNSFFTWCASSAQCPWQTSTDPTAAVLALIANSRVSPAPAGGGRTAGPGELYDALLEGLYSQLDWPTLGAALAADAAGNGAPIIAMSDHYVANGSTNGSDAGEAIDCLDHPTSRDTSGFGALAERYARDRSGVRSTLGLGSSGVRDLAG